MSDEEKLFLLKQRMDVKDRPELDEALDKIQYEPNKPTLIDTLMELQELYKEHDEYMDKLVEECPNDMKIAVVRWAMRHIVEHARDGGSYRGLIYNRMGFGPDAYAPLCNDGLTISNEFDMEQMDTIKEYIREHKISEMKHLVGMCDEPGCFRNASSGWPSDDGYRHTCGDHYRKYKKDD